MKALLRRGFTGAALLLSTAAASASPVVLDTEQKAAAGVATVWFTSDVPRSVNGMVDTVRHYTDFILKTANAATTPSVLMSTRGGITIDCSISGSLEMRMADTLPRVLRVRWHDCVTRFGGFDRTFNGVVAITLPADTFRPQSVLGIRFGNAAEEFLIQHRSETSEQNDDNTEAYNLSLRGDISMTRLFDCCEWVGSSSFEMNGYSDSRRFVEFPVGAPVFFTGFKQAARRLTVIRSTDIAASVHEDDTRFPDGSLSFTQTDPPPFGVRTETSRFKDFHVREIIDFNAWTRQLSVDGRINVTRNPVASARCTDGLYAYRTRVPLLSTLNTPAFQSGELVVNGSVVASFYSAANTPPTLPTPVNGSLLSMRVRNVGTFNYDVASAFDALTRVGQCTP